jgi:hypothetical protein
VAGKEKWCKRKCRSRIRYKTNKARGMNAGILGDETFVHIFCGGQAGSVAVKFIVMTWEQWSWNKDLTPHSLPGGLATWLHPPKNQPQVSITRPLCASGDPAWQTPPYSPQRLIFYNIIVIHSPRSRVFVQKLIVVQLFKMCTTFYEIRILLITTVPHSEIIESSAHPSLQFTWQPS